MRRILFAILCFLPGFVDAAEFRLKLNHTGQNATVELSGSAGKEYLVESASGSLNEWAPLASFILTDPSRLWNDATASTGNRFFRAREVSPADGRYANNFRLIDHTGVARELYYYYSLPSLKAIVLIFAEGNYASFASKIATLKNIYPSNVFFWTIETGANKTRAAIAAEATQAGITWPVYYDPMQVVTRDFGVHFTGEAIVLSREELRVIYRGVINDGQNNYVAAALAGLVSGNAITTTRFEPSQNPIDLPQRAVADYSTVIAPLLQNKCVVCHSPDNIAPFAMTSHESVASRAPLIRHKVMSRDMPPWHADPEYGQFRNNFSLTPQEMAQLIDWLNAGSPRGTGPDPLTSVPPPPPKWPVELGEPDEVVTIPEQPIQSTGHAPYRYIQTTSPNSESKWLRAAVVRPGNRRVVHHYIVWKEYTTQITRPDQLSGIAGYAPGRTERAFPDGTGVLLPAHSPLTFNLHYTPTGVPETDRPELGLWYASAPPTKEMKTASVFNLFFVAGFTSIPAGNPNFEIAGSQTFSTPVRIYALSPHMHYRGLRMRFEVTIPGVPGKQIILNVPKYHFDWQTIYTLEQPLDLPANSRIDVIGGFDNSAQNVHNPLPSEPVYWGEQSDEEMFIGYIEYSER